MVTTVTEGVISTVSGIGRVLYLRAFSDYVGNSVTDGPNIQDTVRGSKSFKKTSAEISNKIEADFNEAEVCKKRLAAVLIFFIIINFLLGQIRRGTILAANAIPPIQVWVVRFNVVKQKSIEHAAGWYLSIESEAVC